MDLFKIITGLVPALAGGPAGAVISIGATIAKEVFGTDEPSEVQARIDADPALAAQFKAKLIEAENDRLRAELADVADARGQTVSLVQAGSSLAWAPAVLSLVIVSAFVGITGGMLFKAVPDSAVAQMLFGQLAGMTGAVVQYWLGSSQGSRAKDAVLAAAVTPAQAVAGVVKAVVRGRAK